MTTDELDREYARQLTAMAAARPHRARKPPAPAVAGPRDAETPRHRKPAPRPGADIRIWADLHFDDERIRRAAERPWPGIEPMNAALRRAWCESAAPGSMMVCAGDMGGRRTILGRRHPPCEGLPGPWHTVLGNHDFTRILGRRKPMGGGTESMMRTSPAILSRSRAATAIVSATTALCSSFCFGMSSPSPGPVFAAGLRLVSPACPLSAAPSDRRRARPASTGRPGGPLPLDLACPGLRAAVPAFIRRQRRFPSVLPLGGRPRAPPTLFRPGRSLRRERPVGCVNPSDGGGRSVVSAGGVEAGRCRPGGHRRYRRPAHSRGLRRPPPG